MNCLNCPEDCRRLPALSCNCIMPLFAGSFIYLAMEFSLKEYV